MPFARILTEFGNVGVLTPLCVTIAVWIALHVSHRDAVVWLCCVGTVTLITALAKLWFAGCRYNWSHIHSLSGHTSFSAVAYGGAAVVLTAGMPRSKRWTIALLYAVWVIGIGITRVELGAHTPQEVASGWLVGGIGVAVFASHYRAAQRPSRYSVVATAALLIVIALIPQAHVSFEGFLRALGQWLVDRVPICW
jgi:membrane-associated phospholipid phosphatase